MWKKALFALCAIIYGVSPYDVLPDFIPFWGLVDDIIVVWLVWRLYKRFVARRKESASYQAGDSHSQSARWESGDRSTDRTAKTKKTPYDALGVPPSASLDEIKQAYRRLANQYHPDKVSHLGDEFKMLAEKRFKEIQEAYSILKNKT